jgi:hypothetical protein
MTVVDYILARSDGEVVLYIDGAYSRSIDAALGGRSDESPLRLQCDWVDASELSDVVTKGPSSVGQVSRRCLLLGDDAELIRKLESELRGSNAISADAVVCVSTLLDSLSVEATSGGYDMAIMLSPTFFSTQISSYDENIKSVQSDGSSMLSRWLDRLGEVCLLTSRLIVVFPEAYGSVMSSDEYVVDDGCNDDGYVNGLTMSLISSLRSAQKEYPRVEITILRVEMPSFRMYEEGNFANMYAAVLNELCVCDGELDVHYHRGLRKIMKLKESLEIVSYMILELELMKLENG